MNGVMNPWQLALLASTALFLIVCCKSWGSEGCNVQGTLVDEQGRPVGEAIVRIETKAQTTAAMGAVTDQDGRFRLNLPAGSYRFLIRVGSMNYEYPLELQAKLDDTLFTWVISSASGAH
jgi:hypothetical protein